MSMHTPSKMLIEPGQEKRIVRALKNRTGCVINVRKEGGIVGESPMALHRDCTGKYASKGILHLSKKHLKKYNGAPTGSRVPLKFSIESLDVNRHHSGGFIPLLLPLLGSVLAGVASGVVEKAISKGSGINQPRQLLPGCSPSSTAKSVTPSSSLLWHKTTGGGDPVKKNGTSTMTIEPDEAGGAGLRLAPWKGASHKIFTQGHGLYLAPFPKNFRGFGMLKLDKHHVPRHCNQFSKKQRKCIGDLL